MIGNYLKIAVRNIKKNKIYTFINVFGLSVGLACCIIIILFIINELTYDSHHPDADRIYRIISHRKSSTGEYWNSSAPGPLVTAVKNEIPQVEQAIRMVPPYENAGNVLIVVRGRRFFENRIFFTDPEIFDIFHIPFMKGTPHKALTRSGTVIITRKMAKKYFGNENPIGKILKMEFDYDRGPARVKLEDFEVIGVINNPPANTHIKYNMLVPMATLTKNLPNFENDWTNPKTKYNYIKLSKNADPEKFENQIQVYAKQLMETFKTRFKRGIGAIKFYIQPITDIHMHTLKMREPEMTGNWLYIYVYSLIAGLVLLIGCMNFINLSTALSTNRAKEVGLRKVVGATRNKLIWQFLCESKMITFISFLFAFGVSYLLLPLFNSMAGTELSLSGLSQPLVLVSLSGLFLLVSISSGIFPAFILTGFKPVTILEERFKYSLGGSFMQKSMVMGQFAISVFLVICTLFVVKQLDFMKGQALGFDKEQKLILRVKSSLGHLRKDYEAIKESFLQNPDITGAAVSSFVPGDEADSGYYLWKEGTNRTSGKYINVITMGADYIPLYDIKLKLGRGFKKDLGTDKTGAYLLNETAVKVLGLSTPEEAIGKNYTAHYHRKTKKIIGVVKDFHFRGMQEKIKPLVLDIEESLFNTLTLKVNTSKIKDIMSFVRNNWEEHFPGVPMEYSFLDDDFNRAYRYEEQMGRLLKIITILGLIIACLGLSGLASFLAWKRQKEIGIRKVLGASTKDIIKILSRQFVLLAIVSILIACPLAYIALKNYLANFAYRTSLGPVIFLAASITAILLAFLSVMFQGIRSATRNPVNTLRNE